MKEVLEKFMLHIVSQGRWLCTCRYGQYIRLPDLLKVMHVFSPCFFAWDMTFHHWCSAQRCILLLSALSEVSSDVLLPRIGEKSQLDRSGRTQKCCFVGEKCLEGSVVPSWSPHCTAAGTGRAPASVIFPSPDSISPF